LAELISPEAVIEPLKVCESDTESPKILEPSVLRILEVTIEEVKAVTVKLDTVISVAVNDTTPILEASASESTPPSLIRSVSEFISIVASSTFTDKFLVESIEPPPDKPSPAVIDTEV